MRPPLRIGYADLGQKLDDTLVARFAVKSEMGL